MWRQMVAGNATACLCAPVAYPTSSASLLVGLDRSACEARLRGCAAQAGARAEYRVLLQRNASTPGQIKPRGEEWEELHQTALGSRLPLEIGAVRCPKGCRLKLQATAGELESPPSELVTTPSPLKHPNDLHIDSQGYRRGAQRIEFIVRPPLNPPTLDSAQAFTDGFADHLRLHRYRLVPVEVSYTGAFVLVDVLEQDLFEYVSGMWIREIFDKVYEIGGDVNVSGRTFDESFGIWVQSPNTWTLGDRSNMLWPVGDVDRTGPVLWAFLALLAWGVLCMVGFGGFRWRQRRRRRRQHGHWAPKPGSGYEDELDAEEDDDDDDVFTWLTKGIVL